jgi:hypothetical protein
MRSQNAFINSINQRSREKVTIVRANRVMEEQSKAASEMSRQIGERIRELKELVYEGLGPQLYHSYKPSIKEAIYEAGRIGGEVFEYAKNLMVNSRDSEEDWDLAVHSFAIGSFRKIG